MRIPLLFLFVLLSVQSLRAQYLFDNLKPKDGLSTREIRSVFRDNEGFMWMGALNGLNRFDGSHFKLWNSALPGYPAGLGDVIAAITSHGEGKIWFGTEAGAGVLDKTNNTIRKVDILVNGKPGTERIAISQFRHDKQGKLWAASSKGIYLEENGRFIPIGEKYTWAKELANVGCFHAGFVYDSLRNGFWIGANEGLFLLDLNRQAVYSNRHNPDGLPVFTNHAVNSVAIDRTGNIWFGDVFDNTLVYYNFSTREERRITHINDDPLLKLDSGPNTLFFDNEDRLWVSTWLYTAFVKTPDGKFEKIVYDENLPYSIGYGFFNDAFQDSYGNVWLATINGVSRYNRHSFVKNVIKVPSYPFFLTTNFANVNAVASDKRGTWWLGKMEGLVKYDTAAKTFERFYPEKTELRWNEIFDLVYINGELWCTTINGIRIFNPLTKTFRTFTSYPGYKKENIRGVSWIRQDSRGNVWFAIWDEGVFRYDPGTKACIRFNEGDPAFGDYAEGNTRCYFETKQGLVWIAKWNSGIRIYDYSTGRFSRPKDSILAKDDILSIAQDNQQNVWVSVRKKGMYKYSTSGQLLDSVTSKDGLLNNRFTDLETDVQGRLWGISREGLVCIQPRTRLVTQVKIEVTYSFNDHWNSLIRMGDQIVGTMLDNLVVIEPSKFQALSEQLPPLISGFKVFQEEKPFGENTNVSLNYRQNFFSIDFSSPFHLEASSIQYAYKLEGFDKDWVYCGRKQTASYTNVPAGEYIFMVRSTDGKSNWMQTMTTIPITIRPPFWKTIWFMVLILLLAAGVLLWMFRSRQRRLDEKRIEHTIDYFANSVYGENSVNEICWDIARNCISQLQFEDCVVYLLDPKTNKLVQKAAYGPKNPKGHEIVNPIELPVGQGIVGTVAATGKPLLIHDTTRDSRYVVDDEPRLSELAVPILQDNKVIGVIDSEHSQKHFFTEDHLKAMTTIASISSNKIAEAQAEAHAKENELKLLEINKLLAESQLMALRAQMNPHFVFNCLNSIQECIVTEKYGEASNYLNKFSKLFRMVLNNSGKNVVSLDEEKEVLRLYLELEQMRFEQSFSYEMRIDEDLEVDEILIPSMLLQPYVENALWHGLMHKNGDRKLLIDFKRIDEEVFRCTIDDNGIGRLKSYELKAQQSKAKRHESKGLKISRDRLEVLKKQGHHVLLEITDKVNPDGTAGGTTITIELSTFLKN